MNYFSMERDTPPKSSQIIVTGATGFIGQNLVRHFLNNNYQVIATARNSKKAERFDWFNDVQFIESDQHKSNFPLKIEKDTGLVHLAWQGLPNYESLFHFEENLQFNYHFVKSLVLRGVQQVLITGTCFEYGFQSGPIPSNAKTEPSNPYALAKDCLRKQLAFLNKFHPFCFQWARLFYMHGLGQNKKSLLSQLDSAISNNESVFNMSGGEQLRDYLPIESVVNQLFDLYTCKKHGVFNVCSGIPISVRRLVDERIKERNSTIKPNYGYYPYPEHEPMAFWGVPDFTNFHKN
jgi:nucleoside-diphosphate-sugar epimerase